MPFTHTYRGVSSVLEQFRYGDLIGIQSEIAVFLAGRTYSHIQPAALWVRTRKQSDPRGSADTRSGVEIGEANAFRGHCVETRRLYVFGAVTSQVSVSKVVGEDEDDIGFALVRACIGHIWQCASRGG